MQLMVVQSGKAFSFGCVPAAVARGFGAWPGGHGAVRNEVKPNVLIAFLAAGAAASVRPGR